MSSPKVLILDDDPDFLDVCKQLLTGLPSKPEVLSATTASRALAMLESEAFSLLLTDLRMPKMDGFQMLAIVRRRLPSQRIVAMSALADEGVQARAYSIGVDLFLEKPKTEKETQLFLECIESMLERDAQQGGFRGVVEHKGLVDIIQLEALAGSSTVLKVTSGGSVGYIWFRDGEVIDAATSGAKGEKAFAEILSWRVGRFELLPPEPDRARAIHASVQGLLLNVAQALDETGPPSAGNGASALSPLAQLGRIRGVEYLLASGDTVDHWSCENAAEVQTWLKRLLADTRALGQLLGVNGPLRLEGCGPERHLGVAVNGHSSLVVGMEARLASDEVATVLDKVVTQWGAEPRVAAAPTEAVVSGSLAVNRAGHLVASTLPSVIPPEVVNQTGRTLLGVFAGSRKIGAPLHHMTIRYNGVSIVATELRGGALIFLNPRLHPQGETRIALPAMNHPTLDDFILYLETYIECWKQFNHYLNLARQKNFTPKDEARFMELKCLIVQGLEVLKDAVEKDRLGPFEITSMVEAAQSLRHLADHERTLSIVESQWHKGFLNLQSLLGRFKVRHQKQEGGWSWGALFGAKGS